jgi:hypothetical protein
VRLEGLGPLKKSCDLNGNQNRDLPVCSIVPQPTTIPCPPFRLAELLYMTHENVAPPATRGVGGGGVTIEYFRYGRLNSRRSGIDRLREHHTKKPLKHVKGETLRDIRATPGTSVLGVEVLQGLRSAH